MNERIQVVLFLVFDGFQLYKTPHQKRNFNQLISWKTCRVKTGFIKTFDWSIFLSATPN